MTQLVEESEQLGVGVQGISGSRSQSGTAPLTTTSGAFGSVSHASDNWISIRNYRDLSVSCVGLLREPVSM